MKIIDIEKLYKANLLCSDAGVLIAHLMLINNEDDEIEVEDIEEIFRLNSDTDTERIEELEAENRELRKGIDDLIFRYELIRDKVVL